MPRCCQALPDDFKPSYASALVAGPTEEHLREAVLTAETQGLICPCVTVWCNACKRVSCCVQGRENFPVPSAFYAHALVTHAQFEETFRLTAKS